MAIRNPSRFEGVDAEAALDAARSVAGDGLHLCVEYDRTTFNALYVDDETLALYGSEEAMEDHFEDVHSYVNIDFTERDLYRDVLFAAGEVRAFVAYMDYTTVVRLVHAEHGLFLALAPDAPVTPVVDAAREPLAGR